MTTKSSIKTSSINPRLYARFFLSLLLGVSLNGLLVLGNQYRIFYTIGQFFSSLTVTSHHLLSTFVMGLLNGLSGWVGNSQVFALNSIADDSFALENLTYAVSNHDDWHSLSLHLDQFVPKLWHGGRSWCSPGTFSCDLTGFTKSKGQES